MAKVNRVRVVYMDDEGNPRKGGGETDPDVILRELPFKVNFTADTGPAGQQPHAKCLLPNRLT